MTYGELLDDGVPFANGSAQARREERRSRRDLHADDSSSFRSLCWHARASARALGDLRRLLARCDRRSRQRLACVAIITADGAWRRGNKVALKANCDAAVAKGMPSLKHVIVAKRIGEPVEMQSGPRSLVGRSSSGSALDVRTRADERRRSALICSTRRGTTAKPKGIMHTTGGYLTGVTSDAQARLRL